jgi:hypothetical protein
MTAVTNKDAAGLRAAITWSHDWRLAVTGGELQRLGSTYYLIFGQQFDGLYDPNDSNVGVTFTQRYTEQIARFTLTTSNGKPVVGTYYAPYTTTAPNRPYHRRDLTAAPITTPSGAAGLGIYGGVFAPGNDSTYRQPVYINGAGSAPVLDGYTQYVNQYTGAVLPMYSANRGRTMFTTFFGGISLYQVDRTANPDSLVRNDTVPFVSAVSTMVRRSDGSTYECVWGDSLPGLLGAEAVLMPAAGVPDFENGTLSLDNLQPAQTVAYFYGGIQAQSPNFGASTATNTVLELKIAPLPTPCAVATARPVPQTGAIRRRP